MEQASISQVIATMNNLALEATDVILADYIEVAEDMVKDLPQNTPSEKELVEKWKQALFTLTRHHNMRFGGQVRYITYRGQ